MVLVYSLVVLINSLVLFVKEACAKVWSIFWGLALLFAFYGMHSCTFTIIASIFFVISIVNSIPLIRRNLISKILMKVFQNNIPNMSATERQALEAGTVTWEKNLFNGSPDFSILRDVPKYELTQEEKDFLNGPVNTLCAMINDWEITHKDLNLPKQIWDFLKKEKFFGMIIPKEYGGLELSAVAQMHVLTKLYGRSVSVATTVCVPNSLGPAELLLKYGTDEQKSHYLPRLAVGDDIPCFALTNPEAGSDAASIPDTGIVVREKINGKEVIGIRLNWNKRYITLCPVATVIGLAFRLFDPDNILGKGYDVGITCALIPATTRGVVTGRRHFPLNTAFLNGPTQGHDVFITVDEIIGGANMAGHGWRMLMECLSAGRAISLPSSALGGAQAATLGSGAYAKVRKQFHQSIGHFEGIEEPLARIASNSYIIDAAVTLTVTSIVHGAKPSVAGAILKYHSTELSRRISCDAMDIHGGKGICLGPNNYIGRGYQEMPIAITVEGANILTRSLIIFGQGAIRCHEYIFAIMEGIRKKNAQMFDKAFWANVAHVIANIIKSLVFSITDGKFSKAPSGDTKRYYQLITRYSNNLSFLADLSMIFLGGNLKRKEKISARLGDLFSYLYLISAILKRHLDDGEHADDLPLVDYGCQNLFYDCEQAIEGIVSNFPIVWLRGILRVWTIFYKRRKKPSDKLGKKVAQILITPSATRDRLTRHVFKEPIDNCPLGKLEAVFNKTWELGELDKKLRQAVKAAKIQELTEASIIHKALEKKLITSEEAQLLTLLNEARIAALAVDDFDF